MAKTLTQIETQVRRLSGNDTIVLSADPGLAMANRIYRKMASSFEWPELYQRANLATTTTADTGEYEWDSSMPVFADIKAVEINSIAHGVAVFGTAVFGVDSFSTTTGQYSFKKVNQPPNEWQWNLAGQKSSQATPDFYRRFLDGSINKIELRPAPSESGRTIRVSGVVEPTELTSGDSTTVFLQSIADDALASLVAFTYSKDLKCLQEGASLLQAIWGKEKATEENVKELVNA
jgi:beta-galactosidase GanA